MFTNRVAGIVFAVLAVWGLILAIQNDFIGIYIAGAIFGAYINSVLYSREIMKEAESQIAVRKTLIEMMKASMAEEKKEETK